MTPPDSGPKEKLARMGWLKSAVTILALVLVYAWCSSSLRIAPGQFTSGDTWKAMGDLVIRLGPFHRVQTCKDANTAWGDDDPIAKPDPAKVKAVCEDGKVLYVYVPHYLTSQVEYLNEIKDPLLDTFRMAILGAFFGALLAVPFSLLAARNLVRSKIVYWTVRIMLNLIRTVPDLVWAALLAGALGAGALPGVIALGIFSFGLNAKLLSESVETIDPGPLEAMQACGANRFQQIRYGVVPQVLPQFLAYALYVLEIDVRASTILGLVGAGGIGVLFNTELTYMRYRNVGAIVVVMLVIVWAMDFISTKVRERLI
ncbi:MAG TPA: phosphonate ABC transporter, permease protein PhnE [Symbiobacteriaceae bacterium]|nr:phosphonate ABC transporter, permease protein PhnE [Symbiobacteriaceae bacterium]